MQELEQIKRDRAHVYMAGILPPLLLFVVATYLPLLGQFVIVLLMLLLTPVVFVLLWQTNFDDVYRKRRNILHFYFGLLPLFAILLIVRLLPVGLNLLRFGLDIRACLLLGVYVWGLIVLPPWVLWHRKRKRYYQLQLTDEEKKIEEEFKQASRSMPTGWGMTPQGAIKEGYTSWATGVLLGGGLIAGAGAFAIHIGVGGLEQLNVTLYFVSLLLVCLVGVRIGSLSIYQGFKYWRTGQKWREQTTGTVTIRGIFADEWEEEVNGKRVVRIERKDGSSKILLVGEAFDEVLPEIGEDVEIGYLFGCEAVVAVRSLAGAAGTAPAEDQRAES